MDSMRSLNTSLPSSTPRPQPPEQLLQSFKAAALSVTNLYKNAVCEQAQARNAGYQEAIEDLLQFLDNEDLGLGDGEGWKVRQWATQRSDGIGAPSSDDDERDTDKRARSSTPAAVRKEQPEPETSRQPPKQESSSREEQATPQPPQTPTPTPQATEANTFDKPAIFTFSAAPLPQFQEQDIDMQPSDNSSTTSQDGTPLSLSVLPRNSRQQHRNNSTNNNLSRTTPRASTREPSVGIGSKRKHTVPDFFDLSGFGNRDMFGGGKRGRFT